MRVRYLFFNSRLVIILVLYIGFIIVIVSLSPVLSLFLLHTHTHTHSHAWRSFPSRLINCVESGTRHPDRTSLLGTRSTFQTLSAARHLYRAKIDTNRLSCTRPSKMQSRRHRHHQNLSTAVANHHHHLLRVKICKNHLWCIHLFGARSTREHRRRRRRRRTSVRTRAKTCNFLLSCTRLSRTRNTSAYPPQTSLSSLVCTLHTSSACSSILSRRKTLALRT